MTSYEDTLKRGAAVAASAQRFLIAVDHSKLASRFGSRVPVQVKVVEDLCRTVGVVDHGIFIGMATEAFIARTPTSFDGSVERIPESTHSLQKEMPSCLSI